MLDVARRSRFCSHDIWCVRRPVPVKFKATVAAGSLKKLQVRGRFFKKLYRHGLKLPRRQEADSMTATCWHSKIHC